MKKLETQVAFKQVSDTYGVLEINPVEQGMGLTMGNALRRVLLSSIEGVAAVSVEIKGVDHEFDSIVGIQEDVLGIIFNVKNIVFSTFSGEISRVVSIETKGAKTITAKDLTLPSDVAIINPDQPVVTITDETVEFSMSFVIERGIGFRPSEKQSKEGGSISTIYLDSAFCPIERVNHNVEDTRIGQELDYNKLTVEVWTNGSIATDAVIKEASNILLERFSLIGQLNKRLVFDDIEVPSEQVEETTNEVFGLSVDDLELSARSLNCLKKANIKTVGDLISKDLDDLYSIKNFGKKSADEINSKLNDYNLSLNPGVKV